MNDINDTNSMIGKCIEVRYRKVSEIVPMAGVTRLYHVVEEAYYNWDGKVWVKEERDGQRD